MRVLLVSANTDRMNMPTPPLGAAMVAAAARRAGHEVELADLLAAVDPVAATTEVVEGVRPEVVGVSVRNIDDQDRAHPRFLLERVADVVRACRQAGPAPLVLGGAGYSIFPTAALDYLGADFGIAGEGETAFPALLDALEAGADPASVRGVLARGRGADGERRAPARLDELPSPYADLLPSLDLRDPELWVPMQTRRGCPLGCTFCSTPRIEGRRPRRRSVPLVVEEVRRLAEAGAERIHFVDNTFNLPPSYALDLCRGIAALGEHPAWRAIVYPHRVTEELAEAMAEAGCMEVALGFESGCDRILKALGKRFTAAEVRGVAARLRGAGIGVMGFLMLGGPGETRESVAESLEFADSLGLTVLKITIGIRIYPGTPLARRAVAEGVVAPGDDLLRPRFYLAPAVEGWVEEEAESRNWSVPVWW